MGLRIATNVQALKRLLFDCDARMYSKALEAFMSDGFQYELNVISKGKRYYVMSKLLTFVDT